MTADAFWTHNRKVLIFSREPSLTSPPTEFCTSLCALTAPELPPETSVGLPPPLESELLVQNMCYAYLCVLNRYLINVQRQPKLPALMGGGVIRNMDSDVNSIYLNEVRMKWAFYSKCDSPALMGW